MKDRVTDMRAFGTYPVPAGAWSDDTAMSLAALDALAKGEVDHFEIMKNFALWLKDAKYTPTGTVFDVGGTCMAAISEFVGDGLRAGNGQAPNMIKRDNVAAPSRFVISFCKTKTPPQWRG